MKKIYLVSMLGAIALGGLLMTRHTLFALTVGNEELQEVAMAVEEPTITKEEEQEYQKLAQSNAQAKEIFQDIKVFVALMNELAKLLPQKEVEIPVGKTSIKFDFKEIKEVVQAMVGSV